MPKDITIIEYLIDVMYPIHKALRAEAARIEHAARQLDTTRGLQLFEQGFKRWATVLEYHAVMEDTYMTAPLDRTSARENEAEHKRLTVLLGDLQTALHEAAGQGTASARIQRSLFGKVVALRVAQDDHLKEEEERVLPVIRQQISEAQQLVMAGRLLFDQGSQDRSWILYWLAPYVTTTEQQLLADLAMRFTFAHAATVAQSS